MADELENLDTNPAGSEPQPSASPTADPLDFTPEERDQAAREDASETPSPTVPGTPAPGSQPTPRQAPAAPQDLDLPDWAQGQFGGSKTLSELRARFEQAREHEANSQKYAAYAQRFWGELQRIQQERAAQSAVVAPASPPAVHKFESTHAHHGFRNREELARVYNEDPRLYHQTIREFQRWASGEQDPKALVDSALKPIQQTIEQRQAAEQEAGNQYTFNALDQHLQGQSSALYGSDPRFAPGGALHAQLALEWQKSGPRLQQLVLEDPEFNPFEMIAGRILMRAGKSVENAKLGAMKNRLRQTGAAAGTARPGASGPVAPRGGSDLRDEIDRLAAIAQANGENVSQDELDAMERAFSRLDVPA